MCHVPNADSARALGDTHTHTHTHTEVLGCLGGLCLPLEPTPVAIMIYGLLVTLFAFCVPILRRWAKQVATSIRIALCARSSTPVARWFTFCATLLVACVSKGLTSIRSGAHDAACTDPSRTVGVSSALARGALSLMLLCFAVASLQAQSTLETRARGTSLINGQGTGSIEFAQLIVNTSPNTGLTFKSLTLKPGYWNGSTLNLSAGVPSGVVMTLKVYVTAEGVTASESNNLTPAA